MPILHWLNKNQAVKTVSQCAYRLLEEVPGLSYGDTCNSNMLIQGDNLEALKALIPFYAGQVKCIYIDPPYNTRSAFSHYDDNLEHSIWLSMMYPRLELLRELLSEDGSIWVTMDDNEVHYLKVMMDEVFGRGSFVASFAWEKDKGRRNDTDISSAHDHILLYAKNRDIWRKIRNPLPRTEAQKARYKNPDNDPRGPWLQGDNGTAKSGSESARFPITLPSGRVVVPPIGNYWRFSIANFEKAQEEGRVYFGANGDGLPVIKRYLTDVQDGVVPRTWWTAEEAGSNQSAKRDHLRKLMPEIEPFATPKPEELLKLILHISTNPNDLILDSFLGSGTTAAVAHKMNRRYIGIEMGDHAQTHCQTRLQKVVDGEQGGISKVVDWQGGGGFRFFKLGEPVFDAYGKLNHDIKFAALAAHIWYAETKTPLAKTANSPLLGIDDGTAYYLLYNGILGDRRPQGGNVLTSRVLAELPGIGDHVGPVTIYGESCRLGPSRLAEHNITFKQIPYDVKAL
ncbi:MAG: site-specific DNA-methyltransferase [Methylomonas sp.]|nr:MAG: site-specific DNA-methyltransferase [Methylomonas sp.]